MNNSYPVVEQRPLDPVPPKKFLGPKRSRTADEIPRGVSNHRLVYRTGGEYVLDNYALPLDSETVLDATNVTVVDVSRDAEVLVQLDIPSKDADLFRLHVTFACTVTDPVAVVRGGAQDLQKVLKPYLKGHRRIFELGLDYELAQINQARRKITAQVTAFTTMSPPIYIGLATELASVEVLTPPDVSKFEQSRREQVNRHSIEFERQHNSYQLRSAASEYEQDIAVRSQRHEIDLDARKRDYERYQYSQHSEVANDPISALKFSYSVGEISAKDFADELLRLEKEERNDRRTELAQQREWEREDSRGNREWERETARQHWETERLDKAEKWRIEQRKLEHQDSERKRQQILDREDRAFERDDERRKLEAQFEIIRELAQRGHLDSANVNLERVVSTMLADVPEPDRSGLDEIEALSSTDVIPADANEFDDVEVREEDDH
ncbi:hypothetical protein ABZ942_13150 [Nocardia sp. NPDC046473]|uniref:hypothetical protein n=1 Tax=Nocardia sp. NPDC046473 TaxID=3155733 RepID=UPI0033F39B3C